MRSHSFSVDLTLVNQLLALSRCSPVMMNGCSLKEASLPWTPIGTQVHPQTSNKTVYKTITKYTGKMATVLCLYHSPVNIRLQLCFIFTRSRPEQKWNIAACSSLSSLLNLLFSTLHPLSPQTSVASLLLFYCYSHGKCCNLSVTKLLKSLSSPSL